MALSAYKTSVGDIALTPIPLDLLVSATPQSGAAPLTVSFEALASGVPPFSFDWVFGDGGVVSSLQSLSYIYQKPPNFTGTYTAYCTVVDSLGRQATDSVLITVSLPRITVGSVVYITYFEGYIQILTLDTGANRYTALVQTGPRAGQYVDGFISGLLYSILEQIYGVGVVAYWPASKLGDAYYFMVGSRLGL